MTHDAYATNKLQAHPEALRRLRETGEGTLITVHLMPANQCAQRCSFCSYRLPDNKNSVEFSEEAQIPWDQMLRLLNDLEIMGVQGIEVTGGGEPLQYRWKRELWAELAERPFATALVTNGVALGDMAPLIAQRLKWARVSIDCATPHTYALMRRTIPRQFYQALGAVESLRKHAPDDPEFRLGVGFVLSNENAGEVYQTAQLAKNLGADNIRLSVTYSDQNMSYFRDHDAVHRAIHESMRAQADFDDETFRVHNLIPTRAWEVEHPWQDYTRCPTKDLLCVVEGEGRIYTCCTFTGSLKGLIGNIRDGFRRVWEDQERTSVRRNLNPRHYCENSCLYRQRNIDMNALINAEHEPTPSDWHIHREFI